MIRDSLAIIVVSRRHPERLSELLDSLAADGIRQGVVVVNLSGENLSLPSVTVIDGAPTQPLGAAVATAVRSVDAQNIWILRDDMRVRPGALTSLASVLDTSPSVGIVGPKVMDAESPAVILEMGESMTRTGYSVSLAERELDQAQYDRVSDVLAVGEAGMVVRREVWDALDGFDDGLPSLDAALDFCWRARTSGWRVEVVPHALVDARDSSWESLRGETSTGSLVREQSRARTHRMLAARSALTDKFIGVGLAAGALLRGLGRFVQKKESPFAEYAGVLAASFALGSLGRARRALRAARRQPIEGSRLFVSQAVVVQRRALARDEALAAREGLDDTPRLTFGAAAAWWTAFFVLAGFTLAAPLFGADALIGGAALPLPATIAEAWSAIGATWTEVAGGSTMAPDGFAALLGVLASLTWWSPNALIVGIFVLAVPLSFIAGYVGAGVVTTNVRTALVVGGVWAVVPTLHLALGDGRIAAVIVHILLPFAVRALFGSTIVSLGWASLLVAGVWTASPSLAPLLVVAVVLRALSGTPAIVLTLIPALAFEWPRLVESATSPLTYFADRGFPTPTAGPTGFGILSLWPGAVNLPLVPNNVGTLIAIAVVIAAVVFVAIAVVVADNTRVGMLALVAGVALAEVAALGGVPLATANGQSVSIFTGPLLDVVWFALTAGTAITVTSLRRTSTILGPITVATVAAVGIVPLTAIALGTSAVHPSTVRTLPAYVEAQTAVERGAGTLVLTPTDAGLVVAVERDGGTTLLDWSGSVATRITPTATEASIGAFAANLVVDSSVDVIRSARENRLAFVLLHDAVTSTEVSTISSHAGLVLVGETDRGILWRIESDFAAKPVSRSPSVAYRAALALVGVIALIAAVPTSLPRRRPVADDVIPLDEEGDDERS